MSYLNEMGYELAETFTYPNGGKSEYYIRDNTAVIIDYDICRCDSQADVFPYSLLTERQNRYMSRFDRVYRFLDSDTESIEAVISDKADKGEIALRTADRGENPDATPLEYMFERNFTNVYGMGSLKYLNKEYCISDFDGNSFFLDYCIKTGKGSLAVEENGVTYHHPQIIGEERYRKQLHKQNTCTGWGIRLYRFSTEDCAFDNRIEDDIREFFGEDTEDFIETGIVADRQFALYEHQENCLEEMKKDRESGKKSCLIVLPTATGKSKIAIEDITAFSEGKPPVKVLVLAPSGDIVRDWKDRTENIECDIRVHTYAYMTRHYTDYAPDYFSYIVIDEAHHAVAPVLKRVIQYFDPEFMAGLTATDERPDRKRLEEVFGSYNTRLSLPEAMEQGIIANARVYRIETNINLSKVRINGREYVNSDLEKSIRVTSRNHLIADVLKEYFSEGAAGKRQGVVFCVNTEHTREMARLLNEVGISARAYSSRESGTDRIMEDFREGKIRFLCSCNMISEGWDYPELGILVMARPTLSKVLYKQQIGRGLRKTDTKSDVFIIDVVDEYGAMATPCSMHTIFKNACYVPFAPVTQRVFSRGEIIEIDGIRENVEKITEIDINDFEDKYGEYLGEEQLAREYFVNTGTIRNWIRTKKIEPSATLPFGSRKIHLFSPAAVAEIRERYSIPVHDDSTIYQDFFDFLEERDYSMSYKMVFMTAFLNNMNNIGEAEIDKVLDEYTAFYRDRLMRGLAADRKTCPYSGEFLNHRNKVKESMLLNPFEKFERKRFMYYSKDLNMIAMNHSLFAKLKEEDLGRIRKQMEEDLERYYRGVK